MNLASLFSGGKDSTYAIHLAQGLGHTVTCLLSISPRSAESHLLHHPNMKWTKLQSESMGIPQLVATCDSYDVGAELSVLHNLLEDAKERFDIQGLVHGGIKSRFQRDKFEYVCSKLNLVPVSPLWDNPSPLEYMSTLVESFDFIVTSVSSDGLDDFWLGRTITADDVLALSELSQKFGFNLDFEGGEAETFVVDCPLFANPIEVTQSRKIWDGYRGRFEIEEAKINYHA